MSAQACNAAFEQALIARDMPAALALLADDVVFFYSNGSTIAGKNAFAATMAASWQRVADYRYETSDTVWQVLTESAAVVIYGFSWTGKVDGNPVSGSGRATRVFRREAGAWRIAHEHLSQGHPRS